MRRKTSASVWSSTRLARPPRPVAGRAPGSRPCPSASTRTRAGPRSPRSPRPSRAAAPPPPRTSARARPCRRTSSISSRRRTAARRSRAPAGRPSRSTKRDARLVGGIAHDEPDEQRDEERIEDQRGQQSGRAAQHAQVLGEEQPDRGHAKTSASGERAYSSAYRRRRAAVEEHHDPVGEALELLEVLGHEDDGAAAIAHGPRPAPRSGGAGAGRATRSARRGAARPDRPSSAIARLRRCWFPSESSERAGRRPGARRPDQPPGRPPGRERPRAARRARGSLAGSAGRTGRGAAAPSRRAAATRRATTSPDRG